MGKSIYRGIDYTIKETRVKLSKGRVGEDFENIPKKAGVAHEGTWRYKRGSMDWKILQNFMKKHVNEPYEILYSEVAKKYKTGSLERLYCERYITDMVDNPNHRVWRGYHIVDGIIRLVQKVNGELTVIK